MNILLLNDIEVDLIQEDSPQFTLQANDLYSLEDRQSSYSTKFKIPLTEKNKSAVYGSDGVQSEGTDVYKKIPCKYIQNGVLVISNGFAVCGTVSDGIEVEIFSGAINFFSLIDGEYISDIDFSDLNHYWDLDPSNTPNVIDYLTKNDDLCYPVVANTENTTYIDNTVINIGLEQMLPAIPFWKIIERMVEEKGFTISPDSFYLSDYFKRYVLLLGTEKWKNSGVIAHAELTSATVSNPSDNPFTLVFDDDSSGNGLTVQGNFDNGSNYDNTTGEFTFPSDVTAPDDIKVRYKVKFSVNNPAYLNENMIYVFTIIHTYTIAMITYEREIVVRTSGYNVFLSQHNTTFTGEVNIDLPAGEYKAGDSIRFVAIVYSQYGLNQILQFLPGSTMTVELANETDMQVGDVININKAIPKISKKDFLKACAQMTSAIHDVNLDKEFRAISFNDIVKNYINSRDWTTKMDMSKPPELSYRYGKYGKNNWVNYTKDDTVPEGYGNDKFLISDETLVEKVELFTLQFAASESGNYLAGKLIPKTKKWSATNEARTLKPRVLAVDWDLLYSDPYNIDNTSNAYTAYVDGSPYTPCYCNFAYGPNGIHASTLIRDNYSGLVNTLNGFKMVRADFILSADDVENFDFSIPVYLDQFNSHFYVNQIDGWRDKYTPCSVTLIRIKP